MTVYRIKFPNGKSYIGITVDFDKRKNAHLSAVGRDNEQNIIYRAMRKHGVDSLEWIILDNEVDNYNNLKELEKSYIQKYDSYENGYNMTLGGDGVLGKRVSEETRKKIGDAHRGKTTTEETKRKLSEINKGLTHTEEAKRKISNIHKGKPLSKEHRKKLSESHKGKVLSKEHKKKLSEAHKGIKLSEKHKQSMSKAQKEAWKKRKQLKS